MQIALNHDLGAWEAEVDSFQLTKINLGEGFESARAEQERLAKRARRALRKRQLARRAHAMQHEKLASLTAERVKTFKENS